MKTIEESYNELVNANPSWINPVLRIFDSPAFSKSHFIVDLRGFDEICSTPYLRIVYMRKRCTSLDGQVLSIYFQLF